MSTTDRVRALVEPVVADLDVELVDVELTGGILRVLTVTSEPIARTKWSGVRRRRSRPGLLTSRV